MSTNGRIALVTGAGSGIGRAAALALHAAGYAVILAGRRAAPLEETARLAQHADSALLPVPTDVSDPASVRALFARTTDVCGRLDVLFNNAGIGAPDLPLEGRGHDIACGQIDIGNAATAMTEPMAAGVPQASGASLVEPRMEVRHVAAAVLYMANLPLDANVLFMTVMATEMPFVGRG